MARPKKKTAEAAAEQLPAPPSMLIDIDEVIDTITSHGDDVVSKVDYHLKMVKEHTGDILPEDISYILKLANRELVHKFTSQRDA